MDDPRWLRIITVGLVLAILAVVYFLLTGGFSVSKPKQAQTQTTQTTKVVESPKPSATIIPVATAKPAQTASSSASTQVGRAQGNVQTLPSTGFPAGLAVVFSASAIVSGLSLRKFPK